MINSIFAKLVEHGWGPELDKLNAYYPRPLLDHPLVKQPKDLTVRSAYDFHSIRIPLQQLTTFPVWKNIMPKLVDFMEDIKAKRLQRERLAAVNKRCQTMATILNNYLLTRPLTEVIPCIADVCEMKEIKSIIEDTPIEVEVTAKNFTTIVTELPRLIDEWRISKSRELIAMMEAEAHALIKIEETDLAAQVDLSPLELATTWFFCRVPSHPRSPSCRCSRPNAQTRRITGSSPKLELPALELQR
jgi:hypothetical protein